MKNKINQDLTAAMKKKDVQALSALRLLRASIQNAEIDKRRELNELEVVAIIRKEIKKLEETITIIRTNTERVVLLDNELYSKEILESYLPKSLGSQEIHAIVNDAIRESNASSQKDMGVVMKIVVAKIAGRAESSVVSKIVKNSLQAADQIKSTKVS